jgi:pyruvate formate lyase activating enzyme
VVITGGEPMLQKDLKDFIIKIKEIGLLVKLDTNGTFPNKLKEFIEEKLVDYVAMDIKTVPEKYFDVVQVQGVSKNVQQSIKILLKGNVDYEFRTTVVAGLHTPEDLVNIAKLIQGSPKYFLQKFIAAPKLLDQSFKTKKSLPAAELEQTAKICRQYVRRCEVR